MTRPTAVGTVYASRAVTPELPTAQQPAIRPAPPAPPTRPVVGERRRLARLAARVALWQLAIALGALAVARMGWVSTVFNQGPGAVPAAAWLDLGQLLLGVALLAVTAGRAGGRWLDDAVLLRLRFRARARRARTSRAAPVESLVPGLTAQVHIDRLGNRIGLLTDKRSWTAIVRAEQDLTRDTDPHRLERLVEAVRAAVEDPDIRLEAAHLVTWGAPVVTVSLESAVATDLSVRQVFWIGVRFVPAAAKEAVAARGGGEAGAMRATSIAALRVAGQLRAAGFTARVLDSNEVTVDVHTGLGLDPVRPSAGQPTPRPTETWWSWSVGALHQAAYRLRTPPRSVAAIAEILGRTAAAPALFTCVSVLFFRDEPGPVRTQVSARVGVSAEQTPRAVRSALRKARPGDRFEALNGEHALGVRATVPLGRRRP